jgi:hypothetical protein
VAAPLRTATKRRQRHVERDWPYDDERDEKALFLGRLKAPDLVSLPDLATRLRALKTEPIDSIGDFRRALAIARFPLPFRLLLLWLSLNIGRHVPNYMGSFAICALGSHGAAIVDTLPIRLTQTPTRSSGCP